MSGFLWIPGFLDSRQICGCLDSGFLDSRQICGCLDSLEAELIEVLATAIPVEVDLPPDIAKEIAQLEGMNDVSLWQAARESLTAETAACLEQMHFKQRREGLSETEARTLAALVRQYERTILLRAQAAELLKKRGHDVSTLVDAKE